MARSKNSGATINNIIGDLSLGDSSTKPEQAKEPEQAPKKSDKETRTGPAKKERPKIEVKSKRVQIVLRPSLFEAVKKRTAKLGMSVNDYFHQLAEIDIENNPD